MRGLEVILDVVYNHTAEGAENGPLFCFRGTDHGAYYILDPKTRADTNYSGCGNTLNGSHPVTKRMIVDSLRFGVRFMVDGFRLIWHRYSRVMKMATLWFNPPTLLAIDTDPVLSNCKMIAEAWDAGGYIRLVLWRDLAGVNGMTQFRDDVEILLKVRKIRNRSTPRPH